MAVFVRNTLIKSKTFHSMFWMILRYLEVNTVVFLVSGSHRNNECGTRMHGNDSGRYFSITKTYIHGTFSRGIICAYVSSPPSPAFQLHTKLQYFHSRTLKVFICVWVYVCVWAATKFQGQSYKIYCAKRHKGKNAWCPPDVVVAMF